MPFAMLSIEDLPGPRITLRTTPRTTPYLCCVCHKQEMRMRGFRPLHVCDDPVCRDEAIRLDWLVV